MDCDPKRILTYQRARFIAELPTDCVYSPSHFWLRRLEDGTLRIGFTKFATRLLGEMVDYGFDVEVGSNVIPGQVLGWVEGFKAVSEVYCAAQGVFLGPNPALETSLSLVNQDPHGAGWLYSVRGAPDAKCVDAGGYARVLDETIDRMRATTESDKYGQAGTAGNPKPEGQSHESAGSRVPGSPPPHPGPRACMCYEHVGVDLLLDLGLCSQARRLGSLRYGRPEVCVTATSAFVRTKC